MKNQLSSLTQENLSLLTDLYQLTMTACYVGEHIAHKTASFELFVRRLPEGYGYLIAMGLEQVLDYLENFHFTPEQINYLQNTGIFKDSPSDFWELLASAQFTGDVWAMSEGTAIFQNEPFLRITAPLWQAQLIETYLLNTINYQTLIATRSARLRDIAGDKKQLFDFGTRRAFSPQASLWSARASILGGLDATSNVLASMQLGINPVGTMAHALVMAITGLSGSEDEAFSAFHRYFPQASLLIDTYDTTLAIQRLIEQIKTGKMTLSGVRLDSGDLTQLSQYIKSLLPHLKIIASGDLDEYEIQRLQQEGAKIDGYGIGTKLVTGTPVNGVYKLVEIEGTPTMKKSQDKQTYPAIKQIFRYYESGKMQFDRIALATENPQKNEISLLQPVMSAGKRLLQPESLKIIKSRTRESVLSLPNEVRCLPASPVYPLYISSDLMDLTRNL